MKLNVFMAITAIVALVFGLGFILAPNTAIGLYGNTLDTVGQFVGRYFGASLLALACIAWFNRNKAAQGLRMGFFIGMLLGLIVSVYDAIAGTHNGLVWLNVVIYLLLGAGFGYFTFMKPE